MTEGQLKKEGEREGARERERERERERTGEDVLPGGVWIYLR